MTNVEISSQNTKPNPISVKDLHNKQTSYTFRPSIAEKHGAGYLGLNRDQTEFEKFIQSNPKLQITNPSGQKVSLLDIETPEPNEAPPGFLGGFFEDGNEARKMLNNGDPNYVKKWQDFLGMQLYNEIIRKLGLPPRYFEPLGFPSGQGRDYGRGSATSATSGSGGNTSNGSGGSSTGNEQTGNGTDSSGGQTTGHGVNPGCPEGATYTCSR